MESMINRTDTISDADTKPFFAATSVLASNGFRLALSQLWNNKAITAFAALLCFLFTANTHAQTLEWVKTFGSNSQDIGGSIAVDIEENAYTIGSYRNTVDFDPGPNVMNLSCVGFLDVFIQKLDKNGNFLWAKSFGGIDFDYASSINLAKGGSVYTTGFFGCTVDFDPGIGVFNLTATGAQDIFIQKLDKNGNFLWAKSVGGMSGDRANSMVIDAKGNIYMTGYFNDTVDFDPGKEVMKLFAKRLGDIFIQKLDSNGNFLWAKSVGGVYWDEGNSIAIDATNNVYTTGYFNGTIDFDPGSDSMMLSTVWEKDIFIQKLDENGNFLWAKSFGGDGNDEGRTVAIDAAGNIYLTGSFNGTVDFDPGIGVMNLTSVGGLDIFIQKLDAQGNFLWAKSFGGKLDDTGFSFANDAVNNVYITGVYQETVDFDPGIDMANLSAFGESDIFIQKLDENGNFLWAKSFGGNDYDGAYSIALDAANNIYTTGDFNETVDFDPGADVKNITSKGGIDVFVHKTKQTATGVTDMGNGIDISLYPNPSNGFIHISLKDNAGIAIITITDLQGKLIHYEEMSAATTSSIDIQAPDGVYFVNVKTAKGQTISKFIKEQSSVIFPNR